MIELKDLKKAYGSTYVLDGLTENIETGEFFVILGPSGTGKSTLLKVIAGIEPLDGGRIIVDGKDITNLPPEKRNIAMVFQNYALYPNMDVFDNIAFPLKMRKMDKHEIDKRVKRAAELLGITEILRKKISKISGGQQQRVAIARAIVRDPSFYLLDEPLSNLDTRARFNARGELKRIQRELNKTFLYVTHDQKEALSLADRVAILHKGKFEQVGKPLDLYEYPATKWVGEFLGDFPMNFIPCERTKVEGCDEIGFRPEWTSVEPHGEIRGEVSSVEVMGDTIYISLKTEKGEVTVTSKEIYDIGDEVRFDIKKWRKFRDERIVDME